MLALSKSFISKNIILILVSLILALHTNDEVATKILQILPNIFGVLLGGIMASLAIIFGLLSSDDLKLLHELSHKKLNKDIYSDFLKKVKVDTLVVFLSLCFSILILIFGSEPIEFSVDTPIANFNTTIRVQTFLWAGIYVLFLSLSACYDIILSLFYLNQIRYSLSTEMDEKQTNISQK